MCALVHIPVNYKTYSLNLNSVYHMPRGHYNVEMRCVNECVCVFCGDVWIALINKGQESSLLWSRLDIKKRGGWVFSSWTKPSALEHVEPFSALTRDYRRGGGANMSYSIMLWYKNVIMWRMGHCWQHDVHFIPSCPIKNPSLTWSFELRTAGEELNVFDAQTYFICLWLRI